jgi:hypothetical protein
MKSLSINSLVIGIGSVVITTFSLLFYLDLTKKVDAGEAEEVGTITFKREVAQRKYTSQVVWEDIEQNAPVYNYDSIRTASLSEAVIHLRDGTEIDVTENSMIMLILAKEQIDIQFSRGSVMTKRINVDNRDIKKLNIRTGNTTVSIEKSDVKFTSDRGKDNLTVNMGNAKVSTTRGEKIVKSDQKVIVSGDNKEMRVYALKLKLNSPSPNSYITTSSASRGILFSWQPIKGKHRAFLEVSRDNSFRDMVIRRGVTRNFSTVRMKSGIYYWRLRAKKVNGKTEMSDVRRLSIIRDEAPHLIEPRDGATFAYRKSPPLIHFKWSRSEIAQTYQLVISRNNSMKEVFKTLKVPGNNVAINSLSRGIYYWRIDRIANLSGITQEKSSRVHKLTIDERELLQAPELRYPPDNENISSALLKKKSVTFTWKKGPGIPESRLFITSDRDFNNIVYSGSSKTNFLKIQRELPEGRYYWRVAGFIEGKEATEPSITGIFNVTGKDTLQLVAPANGAILSPEGEKRDIPVRFSWQKSFFKGKYRLQIARNDSFSDIYRTDTANTYFKIVDSINPGEFFWRVSFLDEDGSVLMSSKPYSFSVRENLMAPMVIFPRNGEVVDMDDRDDLSLRWKRIEEVNFYRVSLYQVKGGSLHLIATKKTEDTSYRMDDLNKLDVGKFRWVLQAFDTYGDSNRKLRKSPEVRVNFVIKLGRTRVKPKLKLPKTLYIE